MHYDGEEIIAELQRKPAGATLTDEQLGEFLEEHQYLDPEDFETVRAGPWSRLMGRPDVVRPRVGVQSTWP